MQQKPPKTSKFVLNLNAIKFKLSKLRTSLIRYEVIYKNLLRDLRKFFSYDFNLISNFQGRKKTEPRAFIQFLKNYIDMRFTRPELEKLELDYNDIVFTLGSLIYQKEMLKVAGN